MRQTLRILVSAILLFFGAAWAGPAPSTANSLQIEAKAAWLNKDYDGAERILSEHLKAYPEDAYARANRGAIRIELGKFKDAEKDLKMASTAMPDSPYIPKMLGVLYMRTGEWDSARKMLSQALKLSPDDHTAKELLHAIPNPKSEP